MKNLLVLTVLLCSLFFACKSTKNAATPPTTADSAKLTGTWELNFITASRVAFNDLYPDKKPAITFNVTEGKINGNTGCNTFLGSLNVNSNKIDFTDPLALTRMACQGQGETVFLESLKKVDTYSIDGKKLSFMSGGTETMRFEKK